MPEWPESTSHEAMLAVLGGIASESLGWSGSLKPEMRLVEDLALDSLRLLSLAVAVEDHFQITLSEDEESELVTVEDLLLLLERKLAG